MKRIALALALLIASVAASLAQSPVTVIGPITPGDCTSFSSTTILKDAGAACAAVTLPVLSGDLPCFNGTTGLLKDCSSSGFFFGGQQNIQIVPGNPASGPGGNAFSGGIITQNVTGNFQVSAYQLPPTTGTAPDWGPISEFVVRRVDGTNFQRFSITAMAAFAGPALNDAAVDYRIQGESGGSATLLPIKFTQQQDTSGLYYEYLTLGPNNDGNVRMFRRIDPPGLSANNLSLTLGQQKSALSNVLTAAGVQDSPKFVLEGNSFDTALHTAAIRQYIEMTSNAGAARWHLQYSLDGVGFTDIFSATNNGILTATTINGTNINATTFSGALTGHASLDLALTGGTMSGAIAMGGNNITGGGNAAFSTFNGNAFTTGTGTLTLAAAKILTVNNTLTLAGTDGSTLNVGTGGTLGTAAFVNTGTSGATIPLLSTDNIYSGQAVFTSNKVLAITGNASGGAFQANAFNMWGGTNPTLSGSGATITTYPTQGVSIAINHSDGSGQVNGLTVGAGQLGGVTLGLPTGGDKGLGTINAAAAYYSNGTIGVTCSGTPTASFASTLGIVTHC